MPAARRILAGVSGSPGSVRALRQAAELAHHHDALLIPVLAWLPPDSRRLPWPELRQIWHDDTWQRLWDTLDAAFGGPPDGIATQPADPRAGARAGPGIPGAGGRGAALRPDGGVLRLVHVRTCDPPQRSAGRFYRETTGQAAAVLEEALLAAWACGGPSATTAVVDARREDVALAIAWQAAAWPADLIVLTRRPGRPSPAWPGAASPIGSCAKPAARCSPSPRPRGPRAPPHPSYGTPKPGEDRHEPHHHPSSTGAARTARPARGAAVARFSRPPGGRQRQNSHRQKSKEQEMTRSLVMGASSAGRRVRVLVTSAMLAAVLAVTNALVSPAAAVAARSAWPDGATSVFYTTSGAGFGLPNGAEIFAITVTGATITTRDIGPTFGGDCGSLALSPRGTLYSMCGPTFGAQQLATINQQTGQATLFGVPVPGLAVMALAFRGGTLYAVGDCNPAPVTFECVRDKDFNALYTVNVHTGAFTRIGPTGAPQFFMDLTIDSHGTMLGVTSTVNPSATPAKLYRIDPATGKATKLVTLVGSTTVMGLAFGRDGKLYASDNPQNPHLYLINTKTGVETTIAALPFSFSSGLELINPGG